MNIPQDLMYSDTHEWVKQTDGGALVGLTDFAQASLGDIVFVNLCVAGDKVVSGEVLGDVESIKAVSDIISPVSGVVARVNEHVLERPELINDSPYEAWLIEIEQITDKSALISADEYETLIADQ